MCICRLQCLVPTRKLARREATLCVRTPQSRGRSDKRQCDGVAGDRDGYRCSGTHSRPRPALQVQPVRRRCWTKYAFHIVRPTLRRDRHHDLTQAQPAGLPQRRQTHAVAARAPVHGVWPRGRSQASPVRTVPRVVAYAVQPPDRRAILPICRRLPAACEGSGGRSTILRKFSDSSLHGPDS